VGQRRRRRRRRRTSAIAIMIKYYYVRVVHGVLMTLAFVGFHYVGAFVGKWLALETSRPTSESKNPPERWSRPKALFWSHVALQVIGLALGTAGLVYGFEEFDIPYELVQYKHGVVGVWVMGLAYFQGVMGAVRPRPLTDGELAAEGRGEGPRTRRLLRRAFEYVHSALGKVSLALGLLNVYTGVAIMRSIQYLDDDGVKQWSGVTIGFMMAVLLMDGALQKRARDAGQRSVAAANETELTASVR